VAQPCQGIDLDALTATLCELGQVQRVADLGRRGPLLASAGQTSLFNCLFGRDAVRMAMDLIDDFPLVARVTILDLGRLQGVTTHLPSEEEPGRILHEHRPATDPRRRLIEQECGWQFPYFGAVDTTPQWINLLAAFVSQYGDSVLGQRLVHRSRGSTTVRDALLRAVAWILRRLDDPAGGGFLWVRPSQSGSIRNQVWEDSWDSHYYSDGTLFDTARPYAPVAVQGYAYDALLNAAHLLAGPRGISAMLPTLLRARANCLRLRVLAAFWEPDLGTFANAVAVEPDGALRRSSVVASSPGHLLASRLLDGPDVAGLRLSLIARLAEPDLLAPAGIRTRSTTAARFRPGSYHNGSVWPMDTGVIADGLRRHGQHERAGDLEERILRACAWAGAFPEFLRGDPDTCGEFGINREIVDVLDDGVINRLEQPPQMHQGWTATRVWRILRRRGAIALPAGSPVRLSTATLSRAA
jgi:glycogen debranching enzyme